MTEIHSATADYSICPLLLKFNRYKSITVFNKRFVVKFHSEVPCKQGQILFRNIFGQFVYFVQPSVAVITLTSSIITG